MVKATPLLGTIQIGLSFAQKIDPVDRFYDLNESLFDLVSLRSHRSRSGLFPELDLIRGTFFKRRKKFGGMMPAVMIRASVHHLCDQELAKSEF